MSSRSVGHNLLRYSAETGSNLLCSLVEEIPLGKLEEQAPHACPCCYGLHEGAGDRKFLFLFHLVGFNLIQSYLPLA